MRKSDGFTLVELLVGILCAAIVTGAAMTLMLMGARTNRALLDANSEQTTARIITTMVDKLASEGSIKTVVTVGDHGWALLDEDGATILSYSDTTIYSTGNTVLMENVTESKVTLSDEGTTITGRLLDFSLTADEGTYKTSVFCRTADMGDRTIDGDKLEETTPDPDVDGDVSINMSASEETGRFKLLEILCSQYGSTGKIMGTVDPNGYEYYSEWYIKDLNYAQSGWTEQTPWCGCFLSWGINQVSAYLVEPNIPRFANVRVGAELFTDPSNHGTYGTWKDSTYSPSAGDLIFFSWGEDYLNESLHHVGAVFYADAEYVYTIEGNNSGRVELSRYLRTDDSIVGYGVLNWK